MAYHKFYPRREAKENRRRKVTENFHKHQELQRYYDDDDSDDDFESFIDYGWYSFDDDDHRLEPGKYPFDDCKSYDSATYDINYTHIHITNLPLTLPLLVVKLENRYALLSEDQDENHIEDNMEPSLRLNNKDERNTAGSTLNNAISNEDGGDESDYEVFQNIYGNKCVKKTGKRKMIKSSIADQKSSSTPDDSNKMMIKSSIADQKSSSIADQKRSTPAAAVDTKKTRLALYKKKKWINSWCKKGNNDKKTLSIYVDSYFRKNRKAGYGVIIRYHSGFPLVASVGVHDQGKKPVSALYLELQGINRGLELAIKYELQNVKVRTNSFTAAFLVSTSLIMFDMNCLCGSTFGTCKRCAWHHRSPLNLIVGKHIRLACVYPLLQKIVAKCVMFEKRHSPYFIISIRRNMNKAADYLAKLHERKEEMSPREFPEQLKDIIYEDACRTNYRKIPTRFSDFNFRLDFVTGKCRCVTCRELNSRLDYFEDML